MPTRYRIARAVAVAVACALPGAPAASAEMPTPGITATIAIAAASPSDGLRDVLVPDRTYAATFTLVVAGGQRHARASVHSTDADVLGCRADTLPAGEVTRVRCAVVPRRQWHARFTLTIRTDDGSVQQTYDHLVV